jgi:hypothetical protein
MSIETRSRFRIKHDCPSQTAATGLFSLEIPCPLRLFWSMPHVPGLRSPYAKVGRLVYFGRMLDKIRVHASGELPDDYAGNLGESKFGVFDARCCRFLRVGYEPLKTRVLEGGSDEEILAWAERTGGKRSDEECEILNAFLSKRGWRDVARQLVEQRTREAAIDGAGIETMFDFLDRDEGRDPAAERARWGG